MSDKVTSVSVVFGATACQSSLICESANLAILRDLTDTALIFAQGCRARFSESPSAALNQLIEEIQDFSKAFQPSGFSTYGSGTDQRLFPLALAKELLATTKRVKQVAVLVGETVDGKAALETSKSWQDLNAKMKDKGAELVRRVHTKVGMLEQDREIQTADIAAIRSGRPSFTPVFA